MTAGADALARFRAEIDRLDDAVIDLMRARVDIVRKIGALKTASPGIALRPSREAEIIRRLVARAKDDLPANAVVRMWRELLAVTTRLQTPFAVAVVTGDGSTMQLARDHFGSVTPLVAVEAAEQGFRLIAAGESALLVLPAPGEQSVRWRRIAARLIDSRLEVIGRLPFCSDGASGGEGDRAFVIGRPEELVEDPASSLVQIETDLELSRSRLRDSLEAGGLEILAFVRLGDQDADRAVYLCELAGTMQVVRQALAQALAPLREKVLHVAPLGSYPRPLDAGGG